MSTVWIFLSLLLIRTLYCQSLGEIKSGSDTEMQDCPPWFILNETSSKCQCGDALGGIVRCNDKESDEENAVMDCYCMTHDDELGTVVGACFYNCEDSRKVFARDRIYHPMPLNASRLNKEMCERRFNRAGRLCGECKEGYYPSAYSYDMKCWKCPAGLAVRNWMIYFFTSFLPLTVFFIIVLVFRISATSPRLLAYVFIAQTLSSPINVRLILLALENYPAYQYIAKTVLAMYGIWNLDFIRTFYPPICLNINTLQVLALDYVVAVYPLVLVIVAYLLIQLHARGCILLVFLWMPFKNCHNKYQNRVDPSTSIVDVFASFIVFSSNKFLCITCDLLTATPVYDVSGKHVGQYLYYDASYKYFGREHAPYGALAIIVAFVFILLPVLLLLLYPIKATQKYLGNSQTLRFFIESFQGSYKDGVTEGKYDCRYFSATFLVARIILFIVYATTPNSLFYAIMVPLTALLLLIYVTIKPYKKKFSLYGKVEATLLILITIWFGLCVCRLLAAIKQPKYIDILLAFVAIVGSLPLLYIPLLLVSNLWHYKPFRKFLHDTNHSIKGIVYRPHSASTASRRSQDEMAWLLDNNTDRDSYQSEEV